VAERGRADLSQAAWFSPLVMDGGRRPGYVSRGAPINEHDSGWQFLEGSESEEWLNEPGSKNIRMQHLGHVVDVWPELLSVISDPRAKSEREWDEGCHIYRDVSAQLDE
jgi:hypothetical protein